MPYAPPSHASENNPSGQAHLLEKYMTNVGRVSWLLVSANIFRGYIKGISAVRNDVSLLFQSIHAHLPWNSAVWRLLSNANVAIFNRMGGYGVREAMLEINREHATKCAPIQLDSKK